MKGPVTSVLQSAAVATGNGVEVAIAGYASVGLQVTIATTATVTFEGSADKGTTWVSVLATKVGTTTTGATATATGAYQANVAGLTHFRARISAWTSGAVTVTGTFIEPGGSSGGGAGGGGSTTQYAEDDPHASGDSLCMAGVVRKDTAASLAGTDGDNTIPIVDVSGRLWTHVGAVDAVTPGTGATNLGKAVDSAAGGTDTGVVMLQIRDDALTALTPVDGDYTPDRCDSTGSKWVTLSAAAEVIGTTAHDAVDANAPVKVGFKAKNGLNGITLVAADDRTDGYADLDGVQISRTTPLPDIATGTTSNTDGASTQVIAAGAAGVKHYLKKFSIFNTSASGVVVDIKDNTTVKWTVYVPATGGVFEDFGDTPIAGTAATAWNFDAASATTTLYYNATAFKSKV